MSTTGYRRSTHGVIIGYFVASVVWLLVVLRGTRARLGGLGVDD